MTVCRNQPSKGIISFQERGLVFSIGTASVLLIVLFVLMGCGDNSKGDGSGLGAIDAAAQEKGFTWPADPDTGLLRQVTKDGNNKAINPSLILMHKLPGGAMPDHDITPINVHRVNTAELEQMFAAAKWAFVDVRKDADIQSKGTIPGSYHAEYKFKGYQYKGSTKLTKALILRLLEEYDGIVFFCNGSKCPRSFNACVATAQFWGVPGLRIRWYYHGVPAWRKTPLIPVARNSPLEKGL